MLSTTFSLHNECRGSFLRAFAFGGFTSAQCMPGTCNFVLASFSVYQSRDVCSVGRGSILRLKIGHTRVLTINTPETDRGQVRYEIAQDLPAQIAYMVD